MHIGLASMDYGGALASFFNRRLIEDDKHMRVEKKERRSFQWVRKEMSFEDLNCFGKTNLIYRRMREILILIFKQARGLRDCIAVMLMILNLRYFNYSVMYN